MKISEDYLRCVGRGKTGKILLLCSMGAAEAGGCCGGNEVAKWVHLPLLPPPPCHMLLCPLLSQDVSIGSFVQPQLSRHMRPLCLLAMNRKHLLNTLVLHPPCPIVHTALHSD